MKKFLSIFAICTLIVFVSLRCSKGNDDKQPDSQASKTAITDFSSHKVSKEEANTMMTRFDENINQAIQSKFRTGNTDYVPTRMVTYDIDQLSAYLQYLKDNGSTRVHVRFAAIEGDGSNGLINGMPYQTVLFYGNRNGYNSRDTGSGGIFDHGELCPQVCE